MTKKRAAGGGRKLKYGEETEVIRLRVPKSKKSEFNILAKKILDKWVKNNPQHPLLRVRLKLPNKCMKYNRRQN